MQNLHSLGFLAGASNVLLDSLYYAKSSLTWILAEANNELLDSLYYAKSSLTWVWVEANNVLLDSLYYAKSSLTWVYNRSFLMPCSSFSMLDGPPVKHWKWCIWHRKPSAKTSSKWKVLVWWTESINTIYHRDVI